MLILPVYKVKIPPENSVSQSTRASPAGHGGRLQGKNDTFSAHLDRRTLPQPKYHSVIVSIIETGQL